MAHAADVDRSVAFYLKLGLVLGHRVKVPGGVDFADITNERGQSLLMIVRATEPVVAAQQAILFYLYTRDLKALRELLLADGIAVSPIVAREYMERGEVELADPDGYTVLIGEDG